MIQICFDTPADFGFKEFPNTIKGNREALKFITGLHEERKIHPWFFNLAKIKTIQVKLDDRRLGSRTKKRYQLESELLNLTKERTEVLRKAGITEKPKTIKIEITHIQ